MFDCILNITDVKKTDIFIKSFTHIRNALHKEYFTPFEREDIYMIAVYLDHLFNELSANNMISDIYPLLNKIKDIIFLFEASEKMKFKKIIDKITEYHNINKDELLLYVSDNKANTLKQLINRCNDIVIQIEYTILKNS